MPSQAPPAPLKLHLLGQFRVETERGSTHLSARKGEALFAYLTLYPEEHPREKLAALFWGDSSDVQARNSLRTALKVLRQQFGSDLLLADRETVQLNPTFPLRVDIRELSDLVADSTITRQQLLELYQGELLAEFYDDWIRPLREQYRSLYLDTLLGFVERMRASGEYASAIELAQKILETDPANERAHQHLMFCYLASGARSAALQQYDNCARALETELNVEPSPDTMALYDWIRIDTAAQNAGANPRLAARLTNLPIPLSSFIGRTNELMALKEHVATNRLLTLTGAGGSGKTRLAIQLATELISHFHDGVWWVDLAPLTDDMLVADAIVQVLGVHEIPNQSTTETLSNFLHSKSLLLVLDNCEHLLAACGQLAAELLTHCANLQIIVTSREAFGITGEKVYQVPTLSLPTRQFSMSLASLLEYEGIRLFVERAGAVNPDFALTAHNATAVLEICRQLDGIPLALELAAARTKVLTPEHILERLSDRFNLLTQGNRSALPRHQTLRATVDWSFELLSAGERDLFSSLSVFVGTFSLEAAGVVCAGANIEQADFIELISHLVDKSLVMLVTQGSETRYRLLETIREYARDKLREAGRETEQQERHLEFYLTLAKEIEPFLFDGHALWSDRLESELENIRAALQWSMQELGGEPELQAMNRTQAGLTLAAAIAWFIVTRSPHDAVWLKSTLAKPRASIRTIARAKALIAAGFLGWALFTLDEARANLEEALEIAIEQQDTLATAWAYAHAGAVANFQGDYARAAGLLEQGIVLSVELGTWGKLIRGFSLAIQGDALAQQGDLPRARTVFLESIALLRELESKNFLAYPLRLLGFLELRQGSAEQALAYFKESLTLNHEVGHLVATLACATGLGAVLAARGRPLPATRLFGAVYFLLEAIKTPLNTADRIEFDRYLGLVQSQLGEPKFIVGWEEGRAMVLARDTAQALELTIEYALTTVEAGI